MTPDLAPDVLLNSPVRVASDGQKTSVKSSNNAPVPAHLRTQERWRIEDFVGYELTIVPEVECVYVEKEDDAAFVVYTVVNERDLDVRSKIYDREMAILAANPGIGIEFNILSRRNRPLEAVVRSKEKPYKKVAVAA